mmetsp:Transcript_35914/g.101724  ORF Transcript_35914/g.101724 Transcript_35914/m.101724 type:complete len:128 (-) Transcript_35914:416-799(-)
MHTAPTFTAQHVFSFLRGMNMPQYASESGQAIELQPAHGLHAIYSNRSAAKLTLGESEDALEDALKAVQLAPRDFITGHVRVIDSLYALKRIPEATEALMEAVQADPGFRHTNDYKTIKNALENAMG